MKRYLAQTLQGIEDISQLEIKEHLSCSSNILSPSFIGFETDNIQNLISAARSINRIYEIIADFKFDNPEDLKDKFKKISFDFEGNFKVVASVYGNLDLDPQELNKDLGEIIYNQDHPVKLTRPDNIIAVIIFKNRCLTCYDITKKDLYKRDYRVKLHQQTINPILAYALIRYSSWDDTKSLLDPFAKDGIIPIEAALSVSSKNTKPEIYCFDRSFQNLKACEINSKLAGINKLIKISRYDIDWLDAKFKKGTIDCIVTQPPFISARRNQKKIIKQLKELFYQAEYILNPEGKIVVLYPQPETLLEQASDKFKVISNKEIRIGGNKFYIMTLVKSLSSDHPDQD